MNTITAFILLNLGFIILIHNKDFTNFNARKHFTTGGYLFSLFIALAYSFFMIGTRSDYSIDCKKMYGSLEEISQNHLPQNNTTQQKNSNEKLIPSSNTDDKLLQTGSPYKVKNLLKKFDSSLQTIRDSGKQIFVEVSEMGNDMVDSSKALWMEISNNKKALSISACKYLGKQINYLYKNTYFQIAIVILLSLVFVGMIRFIFWIITLFAYILFKILYFFGVYKIKKIEKLVDVID